MPYPKLPDFKELTEHIKCYTELKHEYGSKNIQKLLENVEQSMLETIERIKNLPIDPELAAKEPNDLKLIRELRPNGPRKIWKKLDQKIYTEKLEGALLGRFAGCTLGAPVEFWDIEKMQRLALENEMEFPPVDYWKYVPDPYDKRYKISPREKYTRSKMDGVPVDDDIVYTILGLLIAEEYGLNFDIEDVGKCWSKYLPYACTAERIALENLQSGISASKSGETDNPYCEWIGAFIRSDPWGYIAAGQPEKAAGMAYKDAYISHRRQGIYGEMFFSATIAAAFTVNDPLEAIEIGLTEIPKECALANAIRWAIDISGWIKDYKQARETLENKFIGMDRTHTINNACLVVWGLTIGYKDFTKTIGETVAMGMDNDCTAATAGSILGAILGKKGIPEFWYKSFNNKVYTYLNGIPEIPIDELIKRFFRQAQNNFTNFII